ncbi:type II toxin-antitoxin system VapC family toxin [Nocardioides mangrovicus]|uniref:Ribonuclease VapC n=1 Tax=Nocardioides mangrovicus TaxID=2478913 RepID=A0A3L8P3C9_9ACTN|nr:PIN domain-containing protein [Nocardioides mangrovicus]RLV49870.1 type II toxin-antitoxin system VapC family toxin [Nocardioides mangrovicus]
MILVDTSVWIDHLHRPVRELTDRLADDAVRCHPAVVEELALGSIVNRTTILALLSHLVGFVRVGHHELLGFVDAQRLWGRGLSAVDAQLLGSVRVTPGATLWTRDRRLAQAARELGVAHVEAST